MPLPPIAIIVIVIACILYLWLFVFAIVYFFFWDRKKKPTNLDIYLEPVSGIVIDNSYLNINVAVDTTDSPQRHTNDRAYINEDMSFNVMDVLEDAAKKSINSFCLESNRLTLGDTIGKGQFGLVYKAELLDKSLKNPTDVAVKTVYGDNCTKADVESFLEEVMLMKGFQHRNVMTAMGLILRDNKPFVILPFMENGDLRTYISNTTKILTIRELLTFGMNISDGMDYLSKQGFVHRDLAARNCMVAEDKTVMVADFGLSRDLFDSDYYRMEDLSKPLPIKWMAIECFNNSVFTRESDVWSFGVVMWEIMTRGKTPYTEIKVEDVLKYIESGERLVKPASTPNVVYDIMNECWKENPTDRPSFSKISTDLHSLLESDKGSRDQKSVKKRMKTFLRK